MKRDLVNQFLVFIVIFSLFSTLGYGISRNDQEEILELNSSSLLQGSKLEEINGVKILYLNGSYYEMGYQHGYLLKEEAKENMRAFMALAENITTFEHLRNMWNKTEPYIPTCYINEMHGLADGAGVSFEMIAALYMIVPYMDMQCFSFSAWSNATSDGRLYFVRSLDFPLGIQDPLSGKYIQENSILMIRNPENGYKSLSPAIAGSINFYQGVNEKQIAAGIQVSWSDDQTLMGNPVNFKVLKILDTIDNSDDALDILVLNKTLGWNLILSDGEENKSFAVELTANKSYVGTWNNPVEGKEPFWKIKEVVRRTNFFIHPEISSTQRKNYNPGGFIGFLKLFLKQPFFSVWRKYRAMSFEIEEKWGEIDLNSSISILRKVYSGRTDLLLFIFLLFGYRSILCDFHQWSVCPQTGDLVFSYADANNRAYQTDLHYFNMYDLFDKFG